MWAESTFLDKFPLVCGKIGDAVALFVGHQTCDLQAAGRVLAGHHCVVALGKLLTPVCLCHQAVKFDTGHEGQSLCLGK